MQLIKKLTAIALLTSAAVAHAATGVTSLNGTWQLSYWPQPDTAAITSPSEMNNVQVKTISANVPGNVEIDLEKAGVIKDPTIGSNVNELRYLEGYQWCYSRDFTAPTLSDGQRLKLYFGGIDCLADIWVNGVHVGKAENMLIEHEFDVTKYVKAGAGNKVQVILRSVVLEAQKYLLGQFSMGNFASDESVNIRKAPSMYGWDIMPRLVSAGLWRKVELRVEEPVRFRDVFYATTNVDTAGHRAWFTADGQISMPFSKFDKTIARLTLTRKGQKVYDVAFRVSTPSFRFNGYLDKADLWWPRGYGDQALYEAVMTIEDENGNILASDKKNIGFRTVKLHMDPINTDEKRGDFSFYVNGERIFIHGTNWVPLDALHSRDAEHYDRMMEMIKDVNCNMIRFWGGNVYEDDRLFDLCDEAGVLLWQDFAMGCSFYPQRDDFAKKIEEEVTSVVLRLRNHPALALWAGNNENDYCYRSLRHFDFDPNRDVITRKVIPQVLYELDLTRPYIPSSPYFTPEVCAAGGGDDVLPENHLWGPRGYYKDEFYKNQKCTFVSEQGYHGCPNVESIKKMMTPDAVYPWTKPAEHNWNDEWVTKSTRRFETWGPTYDRNNLMVNQVNMLFGEVPNKLEDFSFASQAVQAEAMKYFLEMLRGEKWDKRTGMIWWNLRDGWPIISDAVVDYYYGKKLAYYYLRNAEKDVCVLINDPDKDGDGKLKLMAVNDTRGKVSGEVTITDVESGRTVYSGKYSVDANGKTQIAALPNTSNHEMWVINYTVDGAKQENHYITGVAPFKLDWYKKVVKKSKLYSTVK